MSRKLPAFQFYPGDWRKDPNLSRCTHAEKGVWMDMLCIAFECDERGVLISQGTPWTDDEIAGAIGGDQSATLSHIAALLRKGVAKRRNDGAIFSARLVRDESKRAKCSEAGKLGGNPNLTHPQPTLKGGPKGDDKGHVKRTPTPSSSISSSSSSSVSSEDKNLPQKQGKRKPRTAFVPPTLEEVAEYCRQRGNSVNPQKWIDSYTSKGWLVGKVPMKDWQAAVRTWESNNFDAKGGIPEKPTGAAKLPPSTIVPEFIMLWDDANTHAGLDRWFQAQTRLAKTPENRRKIHSLRNYHARKLDGADPDGKKTANNLHSDVKAWWQGRDFADMTNRDDWEAADAVIAGLEAGQ